MPLITRAEVEFLGLPAVNKTRVRWVHGIDYDLWRYSPGFGFSDGHDHGHFEGSPPEEGWEVADTVTIPVERVLDLHRGIKHVWRDAAKVVELPKKADRWSLVWTLRAELDRLLSEGLRKGPPAQGPKPTPKE